MGIMAASALIGTGISAYQTIKAGKDKKDDNHAFNNYKRHELTNPNKDIQLSTRGTDVMREESSRSMASVTDMARNAGVRGIAQLPKIQAQANKVNQNIGMDLENQDINRQRMVARGEERINRMKEYRDNQNLNAISNSYNAANEDFNKGLWGMASGVSSLGRSVDFGGFTPQVQSADAGIKSQTTGATKLSGGGGIGFQKLDI